MLLLLLLLLGPIALPIRDFLLLRVHALLQLRVRAPERRHLAQLSRPVAVALISRKRTQSASAVSAQWAAMTRRHRLAPIRMQDRLGAPLVLEQHVCTLQGAAHLPRPRPTPAAPQPCTEVSQHTRTLTRTHTLTLTRSRSHAHAHAHAHTLTHTLTLTHAGRGGSVCYVWASSKPCMPCQPPARAHDMGVSLQRASRRRRRRRRRRSSSTEPPHLSPSHHRGGGGGGGDAGGP
eukprot:COSAG01_NODE_1178_length_11365_cov_22.270613_1_plen_233_part_10